MICYNIQGKAAATPRCIERQPLAMPKQQIRRVTRPWALQKQPMPASAHWRSWYVFVGNGAVV